MADQLARVESIHQQKLKQLADQNTDLHSRLDSAIRSSEKQKFEHEAEIDYLTRLLSDRNEAEDQVKTLQQQVDEVKLKVKVSLKNRRKIRFFSANRFRKSKTFLPTKILTHKQLLSFVFLCLLLSFSPFSWRSTGAP